MEENDFMERNQVRKAVLGMRLNWKGMKPGQNTFLTFFSVGLIVGIVAMNVGRGIFLGEEGMFDESALYRMKYMTVDSNALFCFCLQKRVFRVLGLAVLSTTYLGLIACFGTAFWYGLSSGAFLSVLTLRYGIKGILLALISMFPQYLIYVPLAFALFLWCEELFRGIYVRGEYSAADKGFLMKKAGRFAAILAALIFGCLLEGYINPYLLMGFLKIF